MKNEIIIQGLKVYTKKEVLTKMKVDNINWFVYFIDEKTKEKWVEEYPYSESQGGGAPQLRLINKFPWE